MPFIKTVSITELDLSDDWETSCQELKDYCEANNAFYYSRSKKAFCIIEAMSYARAYGNNTVVIESLS